MSSYRPICDVWILARSKVPYYGAYPAGFLARARALIGCKLSDPVLHVCGGMVRKYPFKGFGRNDRTLDMDPKLKPNFKQDAREPLPKRSGRFMWAGILSDPPYTDDDADKYLPGKKYLPTARVILRNALKVVPVGGKVGILHYHAPRPDKTRAKFIACVAVVVGYENRVRLFSVYERIR